MWVFQQTNHCGPGCCVPACLSSLTGIHIDKIIYDPHSSGLGWFDHVNHDPARIDQKKLDQLGFARIAYYGVNTIGATYI